MRACLQNSSAKRGPKSKDLDDDDDELEDGMVNPSFGFGGYGNNSAKESREGGCALFRVLLLLIWVAHVLTVTL